MSPFAPITKSQAGHRYRLRWLSLRPLAIHAMRKLGLLPVVDEFRFWLNVKKNQKKNKAFAALLPTEAFPPARISYDAYSLVDYENYYMSGRRSAEVLLELMSGHIELRSARILEWGCGPGRIVRHLANLRRHLGMEVFATDYNRASVEWCRAAIPGVTFTLNGLQPPLPFPEAFFDAVYSSSVFTHLSEEMHYAWLKEQLRVIKSGGLVIFTTQGDRMKNKLLPAEVRQYEAGELVVRIARTEGSRSYSAFQSPGFIRERFVASIPEATVVRHETTLPLAGIQDVWAVTRHA